MRNQQQWCLLLDSGLTLNDPDTAQTRSAVKLLINSGLVAAEDRLELQGSSNASTNNKKTWYTRGMCSISRCFTLSKHQHKLNTTSSRTEALYHN